MLHVRAAAKVGFRRNRNIPGFVGYCGTCRRYCPIDWWESPERPGGRVREICVCTKCGGVAKADIPFVRSFQDTKQTALAGAKG